MSLVLLPNLLAEEGSIEVLPVATRLWVDKLQGLIAESERGGRRFLSRFLAAPIVRRLPIALLNEHTPAKDMDFLLEPIKKGEVWGVVSDAGMPCIADPGALLVARARQCNISVEALMGPSSPVLALLLSGLSAQSFAFHGYLPKEPLRRQQRIRTLEQRAHQEAATQLFIEAPYRNEPLFQELLVELQEKTVLGVALELHAPQQEVLVRSVGSWKKSVPPLFKDKRAIFFIGYVVMP